MRALEAAHLIAAVCLAILTAALAISGRLADWHAPAMYIGALTLIVAVMIRLSRDESSLSKGATLAVNYYPAVTVTAVFEILGDVLPASHWYDGDRLLIRADRALLGVDATVWLERWIVPWVTDVLYVAYATYHILPVVLGLMLWNKDRETAKVFILALTVGLFVNYAGFFLVPAEGPRAALASRQTISLDTTPIARAISGGLNRLEHPKLDVFPSAHVMGTVLCLLFSLAHERRFFYGTLGLGVLIIVSTVYCRYHYVVDVIAGALLAAVVFAASRSLIRTRPIALARLAEQIR